MSKLNPTHYEFVNKQARAAAEVEVLSNPELTGYQAVSAAENAAVMHGLEDRDYVIFVSSFLHNTLKTGIKLLEPAPEKKAPTVHKSSNSARAQQIRELHAQGKSKADIAKELNIRYQAVYQVIGKVA